jgi:hypothetical protein
MKRQQGIIAYLSRKTFHIAVANHKYLLIRIYEFNYIHDFFAPNFLFAFFAFASFTTVRTELLFAFISFASFTTVRTELSCLYRCLTGARAKFFNARYKFGK